MVLSLAHFGVDSPRNAKRNRATGSKYARINTPPLPGFGLDSLALIPQVQGASFLKLDLVLLHLAGRDIHFKLDIQKVWGVKLKLEPTSGHPFQNKFSRAFMHL